MIELTDAERDVLQDLANGKKVSEIAPDTFRSEHTIRSHVRHIRAKVQARSITHAVAIGIRSGVIQ